MATLNFPSNPTANATYSFNGRTWTYNGSAWDLTSTTLTTTNVVEGSNLYFNNVRVVSALTAGSGIDVAANGLLTVTVSGSGSSSAYNEIVNRPANVLNINNTTVSYYDTYNVLSIDKNLYRSGEVRYNIVDLNSNSYTSVTHNFIHGNNTLVYSNTITLLGTQVHTSHMALVGDNIVLFIVSSNVYATDYFLTSSNNYIQNVAASLKGYVSLIDV